MNKFASMLNGLVAVEPPVIARTRTAGPRKEYNPIEADIRLWKDGSVYPSQALVDRLGLEFTARTADADGKWTDAAGGFGFDVFQTQDYPAIKGNNMVAIVPVARKEGKLDLFATCNYYTKTDETNGDIPEGAKIGDPVVSVMDQGSNTFGKELLWMLNSSYGVIPNETGYIDLVIFGDAIRNVNGSLIYNIPKKVKKGDKAGELSYVRRESVDVFVLIPADENQPTGELPVAAPKAVKETAKAEDLATAPAADPFATQSAPSVLGAAELN